MEKRTRIATEVVFFLENSGFTALELSKESGVCTPILSLLKTGKRKDVLSRHADALREAMQRLAPNLIGQNAQGE